MDGKCDGAEMMSYFEPLKIENHVSELTKFEKQICDKFIRLRRVVVGGSSDEHYRTWLIVAQQSFVVSHLPDAGEQTLEEALWHGAMLAKAIARLVEHTERTP